MANSSNITTRLLANGGVDRPVTYEEVDLNFVELKQLIDDYNQFVLDSRDFNQDILWSVSKSLLDKQLYFDPGVEEVFTIDGEKLNVPTTTVIYNSPFFQVNDNKVNLDCIGMTAGGIRVQLKAYDATGAQITGSTDTDYVVNGSNKSFVASPAYTPVGNTESSIEIEFTTTGKSKATFYTVSIQSSGAAVLDFTALVLKG